jgi:hypothetical protein
MRFWSSSRLGSFNDRNHIAKTTHTSRVAHVARAAVGGNVGADTLHGVRHSGVTELARDRGFRLVEAIADCALPRRLLLPDRNAYILPGEGDSGFGEICDIAGCIGAKPVGAGFEPAKGMLSQERLDGQFFDQLSLGLTRPAYDRYGTGSVLRTEQQSVIRSQYQLWSALQSQTPLPFG